MMSTDLVTRGRNHIHSVFARGKPIYIHTACSGICGFLAAMKPLYKIMTRKLEVDVHGTFNINKFIVQEAACDVDRKCQQWMSLDPSKGYVDIFPNMADLLKKTAENVEGKSVFVPSGEGRVLIVSTSCQDESCINNGRKLNKDSIVAALERVDQTNKATMRASFDSLNEKEMRTTGNTTAQACVLVVVEEYEGMILENTEKAFSSRSRNFGKVLEFFHPFGYIVAKVEMDAEVCSLPVHRRRVFVHVTKFYGKDSDLLLGEIAYFTRVQKMTEYLKIPAGSPTEFFDDVEANMPLKKLTMPALKKQRCDAGNKEGADRKWIRAVKAIDDQWEMRPCPKEQSIDELNVDPHFWRIGVHAQAIIDVEDKLKPWSDSLGEVFTDVDLGIGRSVWHTNRSPTVVCGSRIFRRKTRCIYMGATLFLLQGWDLDAMPWHDRFDLTTLGHMAGNAVAATMYQTAWLVHVLCEPQLGEKYGVEAHDTEAQSSANTDNAGGLDAEEVEVSE